MILHFQLIATSCGKRPMGPQRTHDFRQSAAWLFSHSAAENRTGNVKGKLRLVEPLHHERSKFIWLYTALNQIFLHPNTKSGRNWVGFTWFLISALDETKHETKLRLLKKIDGYSHNRTGRPRRFGVYYFFLIACQEKLEIVMLPSNFVGLSKMYWVIQVFLEHQRRSCLVWDS